MPHSPCVFWKRSTVIGGCVSLIILLVHQPGGADIRSFWTAVDNAQASNPQIHKAEALLRATLEENPKTLAKLLPLANLRAGKNVYDETHYVNRNVTSKNLSSVVALSLRQPLYNRHDALGHDQSDAVVRAALADMEDARQQVAMSVATVSANWLEAKEVLDLGEKYRKVTKRHRDVNRVRQKAGESTATDVETSSSRAEQAEATYVQSLNTLEKAAIAFREVVGANPSPDMTLPELSWREPVDWEEPEKMQEQLQKWIENRPDIQAAEARLEAAQVAVKIERSSHYPTVDLSYQASRTWDSELGGSSGTSVKDTVDAQTLLVSLNVPLFSGGETNARIREAKGRKENSMAQLQALRNQAMRDVNQARMDIKNQQVSIIWLTKALQSSERALAGMEEEFQAGTRTLLELLDVQYEVLTLNTNLIRNRYQEQLARVRLWQALGVPLRPDSPTSFVTLLETDRARDSRGNKPAVLAAMDLTTRSGLTHLQAVRVAKPEQASKPEKPEKEESGTQTEPEHKVPEEKKYKKGHDLTEDLLMDAIGQLTENLKKSATGPAQEETLVRQNIVKTPSSQISETPGGTAGKLDSNLASNPETTNALDNLLEVYTSAILAEKVVPERAHRAVANILRQYMPTMALASAVDPAEYDKSTAIGASLPMANPARDTYPEQRQLLRNGPYLIHLGAYRNEQECRRLADDLAAENIPSWVDAVRTPDGKKIVRLLVGPFASYHDVLRTTKALSAQTGLVVGWIKNPDWQEWQKP
ncbi:MAG: TolC family protein [Magnetococcales bacterium]|nr:TolC family protein [Magnetococcales bacterium]